jgi:hypothetical protein
MKALYALVVCTSFHAFAASADTLKDTTATDGLAYIYNLDDLDLFDETAAQGTTRVPGLVIAPATEPETLVVEQDGVENHTMADVVPGITAIQPSDEEDVTGTFVDLWAGY